jgi:hypothetical protein
LVIIGGTIMDIPTEEGKKRYPPNGIYKGDFFDDSESSYWEVCTCKSECPDPCKGLCGCKACHANYMDFLSVE